VCLSVCAETAIRVMRARRASLYNSGFARLSEMTVLRQGNVQFELGHGCRLTRLLTIRATIHVKRCQDSWQNPMPAGVRRLLRESARPSRLNICEHRLRKAEAGLLKLSDGRVEIDETGLFSIIENGKRASDLQAPANGFLPSRLLVHKHHVGMHLRRERDRLALAEVELPKNQAALWTDDLHPIRHIDGPVLDWFRRGWMLQFPQHRTWC